MLSLAQKVTKKRFEYSSSDTLCLRLQLIQIPLLLSVVSDGNTDHLLLSVVRTLRLVRHAEPLLRMTAMYCSLSDDFRSLDNP